jgi:hypothetical protein
MAHDNGNQDVDGHERHTSTFIIRISDRINFVIVEDLISVSCFLRDKVMVWITIMNSFVISWDFSSLIFYKLIQF